MKVFSDSMKRRWELDATVGSLRRVKDVTGLDLTKMVDPESDVLQKLSTDMFVLADVLCAWLKPQLDAAGVTPEAFLESLDEAAAEAASIAVLEATVDFFHEAKRMPLQRALTKLESAASKLRSQASSEALRQVDETDFDALLQSAISGASSTTSRASSESTQPV